MLLQHPELSCAVLTVAYLLKCLGACRLQTCQTRLMTGTRKLDQHSPVASTWRVMVLHHSMTGHKAAHLMCFCMTSMSINISMKH